jgi:hypothetical protein
MKEQLDAETYATLRRRAEQTAWHEVIGVQEEAMLVTATVR